MENFLKSLLIIFERNSKNIREEEFNFFRVMYNGNEEVTLHSRFISFLLSKEKDFLKLFLKIVLKINKNEFEVENSYIQPNETNKTEYQEIDILLINQSKKQAIIIENKINAEDSILKEESECGGYRGQLERYFNTIVRGMDKNSKQLEFKCDIDKTKIYYLSLYKKPSKETIGKLPLEIFDPQKNCIDYYKIQTWLEQCILITKNSFFKEIIEQYLILIKNMTTDNKRAIEITDLIAKNENYWESAYAYSKHFKDVKWHTIHRFFTDLSKTFNASLPDEGLITRVAHDGKKEILLTTFTYKGFHLQIVNDEKGFTIGNLSNNTWGYFSEEISNINFIYFSNDITFHTINNDYRTEVISKMKNEIDIMHENNYSSLTNKF